MPYRYALHTLTMRHTMGQVRDGQTLLTLPPKHESTIEIDWLPSEQKVYSALKQRARIGFLTLKRANVLHKSIIKCHALIYPLRVACSGGESMVKGGADVAAASAASSSGSASSAGAGVGERAKEDEFGYPSVKTHEVLASSGACMICCESIEQPTKTRCSHWYCHQCISTLVESDSNGGAQCPMCRSTLKSKQSLTRHCTPSEKDVERATSRAMPADESAESVRAKKAVGAKKKKEKDRKKHEKMKRKKKKAKKQNKAFFANNEYDFDPLGLAGYPGGRGGNPYDSDGSEEEDKEEDEEEEEVAPIEVPVLTAEEMLELKNGSSIALQSKLRVLLRELRSLHSSDNGSGPPAKALIFSNFSSTIEWLKEKLEAEGLQFRTLDGAMSMKQRHKALADFQNDPPTTVFLISIRAGAVGINLTQATHVFIMDAVMNPALEAQAVGRVHRMGQKRPVFVKRLVMKGSVEEQIVKLQSRKMQGSDVATEEGAATDGGSSASQKGKKRGRSEQKVKQADFAGAIKDDKVQMKVEELEILFA
jgi:SNF2 family DNA or RNA helicase